jgi:hypothetical protein
MIFFELIKLNSVKPYHGMWSVVSLIFFHRLDLGWAVKIESAECSRDFCTWDPEYSSLTQLTQEVTGWPSLTPAAAAAAAAAAGSELPSPPRMFGGLPLGDPRWIPVRCRSTCARAAGAVARASSPLHNPVRILNRICLLISADDIFFPVTGSRALDFFLVDLVDLFWLGNTMPSS